MATSADRQRWSIFAVSSLGTYITTLDLSIVNVAFAEIQRSFPDAPRSTVSWVVTIYAILFGSLLVVAGRTADRIGRKRVFQAGVAIFGLGSLLCSAAPTLGLLIAGRAVQGVGGALLTPAGLGLLLAAFPPERRTQAIALNGGIGALGVASGPTIGALLVAGLDWRAAFWVNLPVCAVTLVLSHRHGVETERQGGSRPDIAGAVMITAAVGALVLAISEGSSWGWASARTLATFAAVVLLAVAFVQRSRHHPEPMLPPTLFAEPSFRLANLASFAFGAAFSAMGLNNVLFLRTVWHYSVVRAGLFSVLAPLVVAAVSTQAGKIARRYGFRPLMVGGPLLFASAQLGYIFALTNEPHPWGRWLPLGVVVGVAIGLTFPTASAAAVSRLAPARFALGGAVNNTFRQVGAAVGVASVVAVQTSADGIAGFRRGWLFCAGAATSAALISLWQPAGHAVSIIRAEPVATTR